MRKEKRRLSLDNFTAAKLEETEKVQGGDGGGDTVKPPKKSRGCFPPKR
ncbi:hypothetical protein [Flagellimonas onchidii]|nr:hypothetical protein [Allomuricauda onchidii]